VSWSRYPLPNKNGPDRSGPGENPLFRKLLPDAYFFFFGAAFFLAGAFAAFLVAFFIESFLPRHQICDLRRDRSVIHI
jgi:hypothetical protein